MQRKISEHAALTPTTATYVAKAVLAGEHSILRTRAHDRLRLKHKRNDGRCAVRLDECAEYGVYDQFGYAGLTQGLRTGSHTPLT